MTRKYIVSGFCILWVMISTSILSSCSGGGGDGGNDDEVAVTNGAVHLPFDPSVTSIQIENAITRCTVDSKGTFKIPDEDISDPFLAVAMVDNVPVAYSVLIPGDNAHSISCQETAVTFVMMNNLLFTLPPSLIGEAKELVRTVLNNDYPELENRLCNELSVDPQALLTTSEAILADIGYASKLVNDELELLGFSQ